jgi:hypothetical protein
MSRTYLSISSNMLDMSIDTRSSVLRHRVFEDEHAAIGRKHSRARAAWDRSAVAFGLKCGMNYLAALDEQLTPTGTQRQSAELRRFAFLSTEGAVFCRVRQRPIQLIAAAAGRSQTA